MTLKQKSAVEVLRSAHKRILVLTRKYDSKMSAGDKEKLLADVSFELNVLSVLETEVFYPAVSDVDGVSDTEKLVENHEQIKVLIAHSQRLMGDESDFDETFNELTNMVEKHIKEEDRNLFPKLEKSSVDLDSIGAGLHKKRKDVSARIEL